MAWSAYSPKEQHRDPFVPPVPPRPRSTYPSAEYSLNPHPNTPCPRPTSSYGFQGQPIPTNPIGASASQPLHAQSRSSSGPYDYSYSDVSTSSNGEAAITGVAYVSVSPDHHTHLSPQLNAHHLAPINHHPPGLPRRSSYGSPPLGYASPPPNLPPPESTIPNPFPEGPGRMPSPTPLLDHQPFPSSSSSSSVSTATAPPTTARLPTIEGLLRSSAQLDSLSDNDQLQWAQDVIRILDRHLYPSGSSTDYTSPDTRPITSPIPPQLNELLNIAIPIIISFTSHRNGYIAALASYLKGKLLASGASEDFLPRDPRQAFKDFETAARGGEPRGWFRLGRDYEGVGDVGRARDCFQRGQAKGDCEATYRMAMAYLLGQLGLPPDPYAALPLLRQAYQTSSIDFPQPAYVYGMLLSNELVIPTFIPDSLVLPSNTPHTDALFAQHTQAREAIERAAFLCLPSAQYKSGSLYEHASLGCPYDPLMSVQWYSLASQGGEAEADMALSKWFLCGAEGHFGKNEELARTFAEKAARKGHANGCFAMGYYYELGIGGRKDTEQARKWYQKAARLDNPDAISRLQALSQPNPHFLSVQEHETRMNDTLVRKRTQAKIRSDQRQGAEGGRGARRRERIQAERERAILEADRAARAPPAGSYNQGQSQSQSQPFGSQPQIFEHQAFPTPSPAMGPPPPPIRYPSPMPIPIPSPRPISTGPSSSPRPGEYMSPNLGGMNLGMGVGMGSPNPYHPAMVASTLPSRPPIPPHAFQGGQGQAQGQGGYRRLSQPEPSNAQPRYSLSDTRRPSAGYADGSNLPVPVAGGGGARGLGKDQGEGGGGEAKKYTGPATFAEMGFKSKPVEDEGCLIM